MALNLEPTPSIRAANGRFGVGNNANPHGRPKVAFELAAKAREFGPKILAMLAADLDADDWRTRHSAASVLLDRGYGKPSQALTVGTDQPGGLHLLAATLVSAAIIEALGDKPPQLEQQTGTTIDAVPENGSILDAPKPSE